MGFFNSTKEERQALFEEREAKRKTKYAERMGKIEAYETKTREKLEAVQEGRTPVRKMEITAVRMNAPRFKMKISKGGVVTDPNDRRNSGSIIGAAATVDTAQALGSRITATRLLATGLFALAIKKKTGEVFIHVSGDGFEFVAGPIKAKEADAARRFARDFNKLAANLEEFGFPE